MGILILMDLKLPLKALKASQLMYFKLVAVSLILDLWVGFYKMTIKIKELTEWKRQNIKWKIVNLISIILCILVVLRNLAVPTQSTIYWKVKAAHLMISLQRIQITGREIVINLKILSVNIIHIQFENRKNSNKMQ